MFWIVAGLLAVGAIAFIIRTLTDRSTPLVAEATASAEEEIDVCRAQLAELERDVEAGLVAADDAAASRTEIQRRLLEADKRRQTGETAASYTVPSRIRKVVIAVVALTPVAALGLYFYLGHPGVPGVSKGMDSAGPGGKMPSGENMPSLDELARRLEERMKATPEDVRGWGLLGRTYTILGQYSKAADAYRKAVSLQPGEAELQAGLGEAVALSVDGQVTPEALEAFRRARELDPANFAARYYLGKADYQRGKFREAMDAWVALARAAPPDAPWLPDLRREISAVANQLGVDPKSVLPGPRLSEAAPAKNEIAALAARLNESPKDYEGWIRLARLRAGAGDGQGARAALDAGREAYADAPFVLQMFDRTAAELGLEEGTSGVQRGPTAEDIQSASQMSDEDRRAMVEGMVSGLAARLKENPDDPQGWQMLARSYRVLGEPEKSAEAFRRLAELRPEDAAAQAGYAQALLQLDQAGGGRIGDKTVAALEQVIHLDKENVQAHFYLGKAADQRGNRAEAERHWDLVIRQLPEAAPLRMEAEKLLKAGRRSKN